MYELKNWQESSVSRGCDVFQGRTLYAADPGLGKTIMSLEQAKRLGPSAWPVVVVCPASVKWGWQSESLAHLGIHPSILEGRTPRKLSTNKKQIIVINYHIVAAWKDELKRIKPGTLIIDECQNISNKGNKWTKAILDIARKVPHISALSGTPLMNRPRELHTVLSLLCPKEFGSWYTFAHRYCNPQLKPWGWEYNGATHLDELHTRMNATCTIRLKKSEVITLPELISCIELLELSDRSEYDHAVNDFLNWLGSKDITKVKKAKKAQKLVQVAHLRQLVGRLKAKQVVGWINHWLDNTDPSEKLIVFAWHTKMIEVLDRRINGKCVIVNGSTTGKNRKNALDQFKKDRRTRVFLGNIASASSGIDGLQKVSSTVAFAELPWRPADLVQAISRAYRIGQDHPTWAHFLLSAGTIEERLCRILQEKQETIDATLDGKVDETNFSIYDELLGSLCER